MYPRSQLLAKKLCIPSAIAVSAGRAAAMDSFCALEDLGQPFAQLDKSDWKNDAACEIWIRQLCQMMTYFFVKCYIFLSTGASVMTSSTSERLLLPIKSISAVAAHGEHTGLAAARCSKGHRPLNIKLHKSFPKHLQIFELSRISDTHTSPHLHAQISNEQIR